MLIALSILAALTCLCVGYVAGHYRGYNDAYDEVSERISGFAKV
jgi:hypothetical protein